ncbi:16S rRNA (uracil(1498)-N(3))-methyltransferase [Georgenia halophila]|uniref:Ribosomal RNA small subunit methyltransferase E n=1 Tax=Georgenia halophila TaxID=620889 RepID=A0ABP8LQ37_9MICO
MTTPVFHADPDVLAGSSVGGRVTLRGDEARHAATVRRIRTGEEVDLVDGAGLRVTGTVDGAARDALTVTVTGVTHEPPPAVRLVLVQALAKGGRDEQAVEAATELGVDAVVPWQAGRSVSVWAGAEKAAKGHRRWEAVVASAAKQSRRAWVPAVRELVTTSDLTAAAASAVGAGGSVLVLHESATTPMTAAVLPEAGTAGSVAGGAARPAEVAVVVGPEGGITDHEADALAGAGAQIVLAGPHVLRTSTAGPAALAVLAGRLGRWD